ncbi:MAG: hypothetical protein MRERV_62c003 [Mycoplasmataceae bacterium RV_VA103A]|nr:MAG: hypothetical protein MRERV_62c003 [Mycoplasmataceae bacterium RV_VA103A]
MRGVYTPLSFIQLLHYFYERYNYLEFYLSLLIYFNKLKLL